MTVRQLVRILGLGAAIVAVAVGAYQVVSGHDPEILLTLGALGGLVRSVLKEKS